MKKSKGIIVFFLILSIVFTPNLYSFALDEAKDDAPEEQQQAGEEAIEEVANEGQSEDVEEPQVAAMLEEEGPQDESAAEDQAAAQDEPATDEEKSQEEPATDAEESEDEPAVDTQEKSQDEPAADAQEESQDEPAVDAQDEPAVDTQEVENNKSKAKAPVLTAQQEPSFKAYVYLVQFGSGDQEDKYYYGTTGAPAMIDYYQMVYGGGYRARFIIEYENLEPGETYTIDLHTSVRDFSPTANIYDDEETASDTGKGRWIIQVNYGMYGNMRYRAFYDTDMEITGPDGTEYKLVHNTETYDLIYALDLLYGIVTANNAYVGGLYEPAVVPAAEAEDGVDLSYTAVVAGGLWPDTYTLEMQLVELAADGGHVKMGDPITKEVEITRAVTNWSSTFELGKYDLEDGKKYAVFSKLTPHSYEQNTLLAEYDDDSRVQVVLQEREEIVETGDRIVIELTNYDEDTDSPLKGVTFALIDENGNVIDSWISNGDPHDIDVEPGKYILRQTAVPTGYIKNDDVELELTEEDATVSGSVFQATGTGEVLIRVVPRGNSMRYVLQIHKRGENERSYVYCLNANKQLPLVNDSYSTNELLYREYLATKSLLYTQTTNKVEDATGVQKDIMRVLYNGYSNDALGLMEKYELQTEWYIDATQKAIWHFSDGRNYDELDFYGEGKAYEAYQELIRADNELPSNLAMHMYIPSSKNYQDLLSLKFYDGEQAKMAVRNYKVTKEIKVSKKWDDEKDKDGFRPESVTIKLLADGEDTGAQLVLNEANNWTGSFENLLVYSGDQEISYSVEEMPVEGYQDTIEEKDGEFIVTNKHVPEDTPDEKPGEPEKPGEKETTQVSLVKNWDDWDDSDGKRPDAISVKLLANGEVSRTAELSEANNWQFTYENLDKYDDQGNEITYTIDEVGVSYYMMSLDYETKESGDEQVGFTLTNIHRPWFPEIPATPGETGSFTVRKTVSDVSDEDKKFPIKVTMTYPNGDSYEQTLELSAKDQAYTFDYVEAGTKVVISEDVEGYNMSCLVDGVDTKEFTVTKGVKNEVVVNNDRVKTPNTEPNKTNKSGKTDKETHQITTAAVKTGDDASVELALLGLILGAVGLYHIASKQRRTK